MWEVSDEIGIDPAQASAVLDRIAADLALMAKTDIHRDANLVSFRVSSTRWWMGGLPWDLIDRGNFCIMPSGKQLVYRLSMKRHFGRGVGLAAFLAIAMLVSGFTPLRAGLYAVGGFTFLWTMSRMNAGGAVRARLSAIVDATAHANLSN